MEAIAGLAGKAALSVVFQTLIGKLSSLPAIKYAGRKKLESNVNSWISFLGKLKAVLDDAEERQMSEAAVKMWLEDLRDLAYDAEDILDDFSTEVLRQQLMAEAEGNSSKVRKLIHACSSTFSPHNLKFNVTLGSKIREIAERLERITKEKENLKLTENAKGGWSEVVRLETSNLVQGSQVYGRKKDKEALFNKLLSSEPNVESASVVAIVGMGGVGKTTLAQLVYNDKIFNRSFDIKAWICVSEEFDVLKITLKIIEGFTSSPCNSKDLNNAQEELKKELHGKKFLLVLDDVWNENYLLWDALSQPLTAGGLGSKVLITTRNENVASIAGAMSVHHLRKLEFDECSSVLARHALAEDDFSRHPSLQEIGEKIVKKCDGLPLAAKALGGLLRGKFNPRLWSKVSDSNMWELPQDKCPILPALRVSYHYLPSHLKRCFAYCSIFPKDYRFKKDDLILWWMTEGFLEQSSNFMEAGNEYFEDLLSRSFFQSLTRDQGSKFVMHDLMNDLAMWISGGICLHLDNYKENSNYDIKFGNLRHLSFMNSYFDVAKRFEKVSLSMRLRTFIAFDRCHRRSVLSNVILEKVIPKMRCLKLLCLSGYYIKNLPDSISELKQLRYLDMSFTKIQLLPESISGLLNLQILKLKGCQNLIQLPQEIRNLIKLRILDISETNKLMVMPLDIGRLTNLQILSKFIVGKDHGLRLKELKELSLIRGELSICRLEKVLDIQDAREANLKAKENLVSLGFKWMEEKSPPKKENQFQILDELQPHTSLKHLEISGYQGKHFSKWVGDCSFTYLETLRLLDCWSASLLPPLGGMSSLKMLEIGGMHGVKSVGKEFVGNTSNSNKTFPSLEALIIKRMYGLKEWCSCFGCGEEAEVVFPCLQRMEISHCPVLVGRLPNQLPLLRRLFISKCPKFTNLECKHPSLRELVVEDCSEAALKTLANLNSLAVLRLKNIRELNSMDDGLVSMLGELEKLEIVRCSQLKTLVRNGKGTEGMVRLMELTIRYCDELEALAAAGETGLNLLPSLESLNIAGCDKLVSFGAMRLPSSLKQMDISSCAALKSLPEGFMIDGSSTCESALEYLNIVLCPSLTTFPKGRFPDQLVDLEIADCKNLERMPQFSDSIKSLGIIRCDRLQSLPRYPISITTLVIKNPKSLALGNTAIQKSMPISSKSENVQYQSSSQESIKIDNVEEMESGLEKMFADCSSSLEELVIKSLNLRRLTESITFFQKMKYLEIIECRNLKGLPKQIQEFTCLRTLKIKGCPNLELLAGQELPRELKHLDIRGCEKVVEGLFDGSLSHLASLMHLHIDGGSWGVNSKQEAAMFHPGLHILFIANFENLESLATTFKLPALVEILYICNCPKLRKLPTHVLPSNLAYLRISNCPLLKKKCLDRKGEYRPLLSFIPRVDIDNQEVYSIRDFI